MSPEVDDVMVVVVVAVVLREDEVPRKTPSKASSWEGWIWRISPHSDSESDESPVNGTDRI